MIDRTRLLLHDLKTRASSDPTRSDLPKNPHRARSSNRAGNEIPRITIFTIFTKGRKEDGVARKRRKRCSITVDQVFVKSDRLVGHRRAKPSGSLVRTGGDRVALDACDARRGRVEGGGGGSKEEAAAVCRRSPHVGNPHRRSWSSIDQIELETDPNENSLRRGERNFGSECMIDRTNFLSFPFLSRILILGFRPGGGSEIDQGQGSIQERASASLSLSLSPREGRRPCYLSSWSREGSASQVVVSQDRGIALVRPALNTSYVLVSKFAVLPRGACSRRRAVPDWTSLGPWSREGRSRFTSASRRPPSTWTLPALLPLYLSLSLALSRSLSLSL